MKRNRDVISRHEMHQIFNEYLSELNQLRYGDPLGPSYEDLALRKTTDEIIKAASDPYMDVDKLLIGFEDWLRRQ